MSELTVQILKSRLRYDAEGGEFYWLTPQRLEQRAGTKTQKGARQIHVLGTIYLEHRLAWFYMTGKWPVNQIDHRDRNPDNNKWTNLRQATHSQNAQNITARKSPYGRGVRFMVGKRSKPWRVSVVVNGKHVHKYASTNSEARTMAIDLRKALHGDFFSE